MRTRNKCAAQVTMDNKKKRDNNKKNTGSGQAGYDRSLLCFFAVSLFFLVLFNLFVCRLAIVQGPSMEPALYNGDVVVVWQPFYQPRAGDIVVTNRANPLKTNLIKRVAAVEGQRIEIRAGQVYVDNERQTFLTEDYEAQALSLIVPKGEVFLLGDNFGASVDSRSIGCIPVSDILGKVVFCIPLHKRPAAALPAVFLIPPAQHVCGTIGRGEYL